MYKLVIDVKENVHQNLASYKEIKSNHTDGFIKACKKHNLEFIKMPNDVNIIRNKGKIIGGLNGMVSSLVSSFSRKVAGDKLLTNSILSSCGINVPQQLYFKPNGLDEALEAWRSHRLSVVKPSNAAGGAGITLSVHDENSFKNAFEFAKKNTRDSGFILLEQEISGFDIRAVVVGDEFACAVSRLPPHVKGDGISTISELIEIRNLERKKHPHHKRFLIQAEYFDINLSTIPSNGEVVFLSNISNIHRGGEAIDVTDQISDEIKSIAIEAVKSVPGLNVAGVDFLVKDFNDASAAYIIELNTAANFGINYYPFYGKSRNPAENIILKFLENSST